MLDLASSLRSLTSDVMKKLNSAQERKNGRDTETSRDAFSYDVCEGELGGNEGVRMCVWVSVYVCGVYGVLQCTTRKTMLNRELPFSKMKK